MVTGKHSYLLMKVVCSVRTVGCFYVTHITLYTIVIQINSLVKILSIIEIWLCKVFLKTN